MRRIPSAFLLIFFLSPLVGFSARSSVVRIEPALSENQIQLKLFLTAGYGIQKGSLHQIDLYVLSPQHEQSKELDEKIKKHGRLVQTQKSLSGITARQNKKYFSLLKPIVFKKPKNISSDYIVQGKLFYCSFQDGFCSIYPFQLLIPSPRNNGPSL